MSTQNTIHPSDHPSDSLLSYLEDQLSPIDKAAVQEHIHSCSKCSEELQRIDYFTRLLKNHKEAFCPEPWELFQSVEDPRNSSEDILSHLDGCSVCQGDLAEYSVARGDAKMPGRLMAEMRLQFPEGASDTHTDQETSYLRSLIDRAKMFFSMPVMAVGTAVAAVLLTVLLLPQQESSPAIMLSSVPWTTDQQGLVPKTGIRLMGPGKQTRNVAIVVLSKDVRLSGAQDKIDQIYRDLKPSEAIEREFHIVSPGKMREALAGMNARSLVKGDILQSLRDKMDVSNVLFITVSRERNEFQIQSELLDAVTGVLIGETATRALTEANLIPGMRDSAFSLLNALRHES